MKTHYFLKFTMPNIGIVPKQQLRQASAEIFQQIHAGRIEDVRTLNRSGRYDWDVELVILKGVGFQTAHDMFFQAQGTLVHRAKQGQQATTPYYVLGNAIVYMQSF